MKSLARKQNISVEDMRDQVLSRNSTPDPTSAPAPLDGDCYEKFADQMLAYSPSRPTEPDEDDVAIELNINSEEMDIFLMSSP